MRERDLVADSRHLQRALRGWPTLSDAFRDSENRWSIEIAVPFETRSGRRVLAGSGPVEIVQNFAEGFFASASATPGAQGFLLDGNGRTLSASVPREGGAATPDERLLAALERGSSGVYGDRTFISTSVPQSRWRIVLSVPTAQLYASVDGTPRRAAWQLFAAFSAAICALLGLGWVAARSARRLAASTERELAARALAQERLQDPLTGLPNRTLFHDRADHALAAARRGSRSLAVAFMDIDHFKGVNDSLGHEAGDAVLREVGRRLDSSVRAQDTVSRFGGDEFVVLCEDVEDDTVVQLISRIQQGIAGPVPVGDRQLRVTLSIGVALYTEGDPATTAGDLLRDADAAMYRAKELGRGRVEVFDARQHQRAIRRLDAEVALRQAIDDGELLVHYQPIVALPDGGLHGVEALVRWRRSHTGELVPPGDFIPLAEETGLIAEIGDFVLRTAVREVGNWVDRGLVHPELELSVNVSASQLADPGLADAVSDALTGWNRPSHLLCLEITETAVMKDPSAAERTLSELDALGVQLALDDFGVGHSSLGQLARSSPISTLKLDRSFVAGMSGARDRGIVAAAASLALALELSSVAEGVETAEQATQLAAMGFPYGQGFHFGRPVPGAELLERFKPAIVA